MRVFVVVGKTWWNYLELNQLCVFCSYSFLFTLYTHIHIQRRKFHSQKFTHTKCARADLLTGLDFQYELNWAILCPTAKCGSYTKMFKFGPFRPKDTGSQRYRLFYFGIKTGILSSLFHKAHKISRNLSAKCYKIAVWKSCGSTLWFWNFHLCSYKYGSILCILMSIVNVFV